jgi:hypothetical protein
MANEALGRVRKKVHEWKQRARQLRKLGSPASRRRAGAETYNVQPSFRFTLYDIFKHNRSAELFLIVNLELFKQKASRVGATL